MRWLLPEHIDDILPDEAMRIELRHAQVTLASGESLDGAHRFAQGAGRHGGAA